MEKKESVSGATYSRLYCKSTVYTVQYILSLRQVLGVCEVKHSTNSTTKHANMAKNLLNVATAHGYCSIEIVFSFIIIG